MFCCVCKEKEAKVHLTQMDLGKRREAHICEDCAKKSGISDTTEPSLAAILAALQMSDEGSR